MTQAWRRCGSGIQHPPGKGNGWTTPDALRGPLKKGQTGKVCLFFAYQAACHGSSVASLLREKSRKQEPQEAPDCTGWTAAGWTQTKEPQNGRLAGPPGGGTG